MNLEKQEYEQRDMLSYGIKRWKRVQYLADQFWQQWRKSYLHELQARQKWLTKSESLKAGDIVVLKDKSLARVNWPLARIEAVKKSSD